MQVAMDTTEEHKTVRRGTPAGPFSVSPTGPEPVTHWSQQSPGIGLGFGSMAE